MELTATAILEEADRVLATEEQWAKGSFYSRTRDGKVGNGDADYDDATCFCLMGAENRAVYNLAGMPPYELRNDGWVAYEAATALIEEALPTNFLKDYGRVPMMFNDRSPQTFCRQGHEYTEANSYVYPNGDRMCRVCRNQRLAKYRQKGQSVVCV